MKSREDDLKKKDEANQPSTPGLGRRDLMKIGAGVVVTTLAGHSTIAHAAEPEPAKAPTPTPGPRPAAVPAGKDWKEVPTGAGYINNAGRISGNGPMDRTTRQLVEYTTSFSDALMTKPVLDGIGTYMVDTIAALMAGFESEPGRVGAKIGRTVQSTYKSTIMGYGVVTTPQLAAFTNACMVRHCDYNDAGPGSHTSDIVPGVLAIGEALHSTGLQCLSAIALGIEVMNALGHAEADSETKVANTGGGSWDSKYDGVAAVLAVGKLMGLNEDRLANAVSMTLVPHTPLFVAHVGALSHWKGVHSPMAVHDAVFAALLAKEGMTGPAQPFEERGGLWDSVTGPFSEMHLPVKPGQLVAANMRYKRFPAERNAQSILLVAVPAIRDWAKVDDIASVRVEMPFPFWQEIADPPKWDPQNRETADHSLPFMMSVALTDGEVYLDAFTPKRYRDDKAVRGVMQKITCVANPEFGVDRARVTVRKKSGEEMTKDVFKDDPVTKDEVMKKFDRVFAYKQVPNDQRDRARKTWANLQDVKDIGVPIRDLANFGKPEPL